MRRKPPEGGPVGRSDVSASVPLPADATLHRLGSYRVAAQRIRRAEGSLGARMAGLITLAQRARSEPDRWAREIAEAIVWSQASWLLEGADALRAQGTIDMVERAARQIRTQTGRDTCPTCLRHLSDPADWVYWRALREAELVRLRALESDDVVDTEDVEA